jgi:hypothetical protein
MLNNQLVVVGFELQMRVSLRCSEMVYLRGIDWRGDGRPDDHLQGLNVSDAMFFNLNPIAANELKQHDSVISSTGPTGSPS